MSVSSFGYVVGLKKFTQPSDPQLNGPRNRNPSLKIWRILRVRVRLPVGRGEERGMGIILDLEFGIWDSRSPMENEVFSKHNRFAEAR